MAWSQKERVLDVALNIFIFIGYEEQLNVITKGKVQSCPNEEDSAPL